MLPASLQPAIEFYRPDRLCSTAGIQDNLLFGRIAEDKAGAEQAVHRVVRQVLAERGLDDDVFRIGLHSRIDAGDDGLTPPQKAAIDLVRCLIRRADTVVVERALVGLPAGAAEALVERLRRALVGRGLVIVTPGLTPSMDVVPFDAVLRFERGAVASWEDRRTSAATAPVPA
jgi:ABC-type transport system involved in cytochrome bd biosynthesis fused ATPase/permease subunit